MNEELIARVQSRLARFTSETDLHVPTWPLPVAQVFDQLTGQLDAERESSANAAYYADEEASRQQQRITEQRRELDDRDRRIRDLEGELYEAQRNAERARQEAGRGW